MVSALECESSQEEIFNWAKMSAVAIFPSIVLPLLKNGFPKHLATVVVVVGGAISLAPWFAFALPRFYFLSWLSWLRIKSSQIKSQSLAHKRVTSWVFLLGDHLLLIKKGLQCVCLLGAHLCAGWQDEEVLFQINLESAVRKKTNEE